MYIYKHHIQIFTSDHFFFFTSVTKLQQQIKANKNTASMDVLADQDFPENRELGSSGNESDREGDDIYETETETDATTTETEEEEDNENPDK